MPFTSETAGHYGKTLKRGPSERTQILNDLLVPEKVKAVWEQLETKALAGEVEAIKVYIAYCFGKPKETKDVRFPEGLNIYLKRAGEVLNLSAKREVRELS